MQTPEGGTFSFVRDFEGVVHVDTFIPFKMLELLMAATSGRFASVFMSVFTSGPVFAMESGCLQLPSRRAGLGNVWQHWMGKRFFPFQSSRLAILDQCGKGPCQSLMCKPIWTSRRKQIAAEKRQL